MLALDAEAGRGGKKRRGKAKIEEVGDAAPAAGRGVARRGIAEAAAAAAMVTDVFDQLFGDHATQRVQGNLKELGRYVALKGPTKIQQFLLLFELFENTAEGERCIIKAKDRDQTVGGGGAGGGGTGGIDSSPIFVIDEGLSLPPGSYDLTGSTEVWKIASLREFSKWGAVVSTEELDKYMAGLLRRVSAHDQIIIALSAFMNALDDAGLNKFLCYLYHPQAPSDREASAPSWQALIHGQFREFGKRVGLDDTFFTGFHEKLCETTTKLRDCSALFWHENQGSFVPFNLAYGVGHKILYETISALVENPSDSPYQLYLTMSIQRLIMGSYITYRQVNAVKFMEYPNRVRQLLWELYAAQYTTEILGEVVLKATASARAGERGHVPNLHHFFMEKVGEFRAPNPEASQWLKNQLWGPLILPSDERFLTNEAFISHVKEHLQSVVHGLHNHPKALMQHIENIQNIGAPLLYPKEALQLPEDLLMPARQVKSQLVPALAHVCVALCKLHAGEDAPDFAPYASDGAISSGELLALLKGFADFEANLEKKIWECDRKLATLLLNEMPTNPFINRLIMLRAAIDHSALDSVLGLNEGLMQTAGQLVSLQDRHTELEVESSNRQKLLDAFKGRFLLLKEEKNSLEATIAQLRGELLARDEESAAVVRRAEQVKRKQQAQKKKKGKKKSPTEDRKRTAELEAVEARLHASRAEIEALKKSREKARREAAAARKAAQEAAQQQEAEAVAHREMERRYTTVLHAKTQLEQTVKRLKAEADKVSRLEKGVARLREMRERNQALQQELKAAQAKYEERLKAQLEADKIAHTAEMVAKITAQVRATEAPLLKQIAELRAKLAAAVAEKEAMAASCHPQLKVDSSGNVFVFGQRGGGVAGRINADGHIDVNAALFLPQERHEARHGAERKRDRRESRRKHR